jgi:hypothetical protein
MKPTNSRTRPRVPTKSEIKAALGDCSDAELGRLIGRTRQAVHLWPDSQPIPELSWYRLRDQRPDVFGVSPTAEGGVSA